MKTWFSQSQASDVPTFGAEAVVAAVLTLGGVALIEGGWLAYHLGSSGHPLIAPFYLAALTGFYLLYLCARSGARVGRASILLVWTVVTGAALLLNLATLPFVALQLLLISSARSLLFHPRPLAFVADLGLSLVAGLAALWMLFETSSSLLTIWTYFLIQAGWSWIGRQKDAPSDAVSEGTQAFDAAHASATAAIRRLTRRHHG